MTPDNTDIFVYDIAVVDGTLTAYASVQVSGVLTDPDAVAFSLYAMPRSIKTAFAGDLIDGKVTKIADGIYRYVEDVSTLADGKYEIDCKTSFVS